MQKKITIELEMDSEWESAVYAGLGDLLATIEDESNFKLKNVKVEDANVVTLPNIAIRSGEGLSGVASKTFNNRSRYYDDYDGQ